MTPNLVFDGNVRYHPFPAVGRLQRDLSGSGPNRFRPENAGFLRLQVTHARVVQWQSDDAGGELLHRGKFDPHGYTQTSIVRHALSSGRFFRYNWI